ncbi:hypothetical protein E4634_14120 [Mangrovimicrobium sediminis]|uniref:Uncharacterized protein n=1 Tax=Mangrovimicrobium sediminis TaxID=2562682 RepID=A0A4Z0LZ41_9GAMM|nr:hypothetical protein [Haliea sp. SAOS-164]TGD72653.1 hypothetical protein E4634_14120 [Haliea sp. SAOS-164]
MIMNKQFAVHMAGLALAGALTAPVQAQLKTDVAAASFSAGIEGEYASLPELAQKMVENTQLAAITSRGEKMIMVVGVVDIETGHVVYGSLSEPILANPGKSALIEIGAGRLVSSWQAFEDPIFGFEDPLFGFEDPIFGFEDPIFGFEDPIFGFEDPLFGGEAPPSLEAVWGTNGVAFKPQTSDAYYGGVGSREAQNPEQVLYGIWGVGGASYEGPAEYMLIVAPLSLDAGSEVGYSAAILPFTANRK